MAAGAFERLTVIVCLAFTAALSVGWSVLVCQPTGWTKKMSVFYVIDCGLLRVTIGPGVAQEVVGAVLDQISQDAANKLRNFFRGTYDQQEFKEYMCSIVLPPPLNDPCGIWQNLHWASWTMFFCAVLGVILSSTAGLMLYYWCFVKPRAVMRNWIRALYGIATVLYMSGVFTYCILTRETNNMPPRTEGTTLGPCVMIAVVLTVLSFLPVLISAVTVVENAEEVRNELLSEQKHMEREVAFAQLGQGRYGATGAASAQVDPGYMTASPLPQHGFQAAPSPMYQQPATGASSDFGLGQPSMQPNYGQPQTSTQSYAGSPQQPAW